MAVVKNGLPILGVVYFPAYDEIFTAERGGGTYLNGKRVKLSKVKSLEYSYITHGSLKKFEQTNSIDNFLTLCKTVQTSRGYASPLSYKLLLEGKVDAVLEPGGKIYDFAAPSILVREAGGKFTDFSGRRVLTSNNGLFSNGLVHEQVLKILNA